MDFVALLGYLVGLAVIAFISICVGIYLMSETFPSIASHESEDFFSDPSSGKKLPFPSITDKPSISLTVVVPAYNEEKRLPVMLEESLTYLEEKVKKDNTFTYEMIIVDDGSKDKTTEVAMGYSKKFGCEKVRVLTLAWNRGKGGAVRMGMFRGRGKLLLFADADGATTFSEYDRVEEGLEEESVATRSFFRTVLMYGFHALVWLFAVRGVRDTQCGFKLLTRRAARILFNSLHVERWAFDVEMLYLAQSLKIPIDEVAVEWNEIEGTKMTPVLSWLEMGLDLFTIWLRYTLGAWRIRGDIKK